MARPYRLQTEDCFYHITSRGNDRKKIFLNDTDFEKFLEYIVTAKGKYEFYLLAYVLTRQQGGQPLTLDKLWVIMSSKKQILEAGDGQTITD